MDVHIGIWEMLLRFLCALGLSLILGWERESKRKPAGLRTHMMVGLGSASLTILIFEMYASSTALHESFKADPLRIIEGVMGGLGFLGAGCIIQSRGSVEGITTAATIWVVGSVGVASGAGEFLLAGITTMFAFMILTAMHLFEKRVTRNDAPPKIDANAPQEQPAE